ncbi:MAG: MutT [Candidatus Levybacteria bacterium]|nr:MutT [Candidatus Levybacteria bacterium]
MSQWKIVSQKTILKTQLFDVKEVVFKNKSGKEKIHHVAQRDTVVTIFPLTDSYEIYLVSQYRYMLEKTVLEAPSGYIKKKETVIEAAKRELKEETGITAQQFEELARVDLASSVFKSKVHLFLAKGLEMGEANLDEDEKISMIKMSLSQAVEKVMTGEINHAASMAGILLLDKLRREKKL